MPKDDIRVHEVTFCNRVSKWADALFQSHPDMPFRRTEIEESKGTKRKRSDLRVYVANDKLVLAGEVKLPGTPEGRNAYNSALVEDSYQKAANAGAEFFFTWNVNKLVLFDSKQWQKPIMERRLKDYDLGLDLDKPEDVSRAEVEKAVRELLGRFFADFQDILAGRQPDWGMAPDEFFIRAFESHISWPVKLTAEFLWASSAKAKAFDSLLQEWMAADQGWAVIRNDPETWRLLVDRAARTLCYVFANRLLFYESVRTKFEELEELRVPQRAASADELYLHFQRMFQLAVDATGDYETLFYPAEKDWAGPHIFGHEHSLEAWRSVLENLRPFNFKEIRADILGGIFKRIIEPEERHKFGQHYTNEDLVDLVNAFCIRKAEDSVLDTTGGRVVIWRSHSTVRPRSEPGLTGWMSLARERAEMGSKVGDKHVAWILRGENSCLMVRVWYVTGAPAVLGRGTFRASRPRPLARARPAVRFGGGVVNDARQEARTMNKILIVGTVVIEDVQTPRGSSADRLGGSGIYASVGAQFSQRVRLVGAVGNDFNESHLRDLERMNIDLRDLEHRNGDTFRWKAKYSDDLRARETLEIKLGVYQNFEPTLGEELVGVPNVFLAAMDPEGQAKVLHQLKGSRFLMLGTVDHWVNKKPARIRELLPQVHGFIANEEEMTSFAGEPDPAAAARVVRSWGPEFVVVTLAHKGAVLVTPKEEFQVPAFPCKPVPDPTGAGDSFAGAFLGSLSHVASLRSETYVEAVLSATAVASFCVQGFGLDGFKGVTRRSILDRIQYLRPRVARNE